MPFQRSDPTSKTGRKKSTGYSDLTPEEKKKYHHEKVKKHRNQDDSLQGPSESPSNSSEASSQAHTASTPDKDSSTKKRGPGRAPLGENPMTPNTKRTRKNESQQKIRRKEKLFRPLDCKKI